MMRWLKLAVLPPLGAVLIRLLGKALRIKSVGHAFVDECSRRERAIIIVFWHGRQLMMPLAYRGKEAHILISQHRDGELIHRIVARFGFRAVRGSSTRGGTAALRRMITLGRAGKDLVVTPDGPKGPRQVAQVGIIHLARATGLPIVPLAFGCSKKKSLEAGIVSSFRFPQAEACSCGGNPYGCRRIVRDRISKRSGVNSSRNSIASRRRRMNSPIVNRQSSSAEGRTFLPQATIHP